MTLIVAIIVQCRRGLLDMGNKAFDVRIPLSNQTIGWAINATQEAIGQFGRRHRFAPFLQ